MDVLLAEDDASTLLVTGRILTQTFDCAVLVAHTGLEALDLLQHTHVDAVVLSVDLPLPGGIETLRLLRSTQQWARLPVVALSGSQEARLVDALISLGVRDIVIKPVGERFSDGFGQLLKALRFAERERAGLAASGSQR